MTLIYIVYEAPSFIEKHKGLEFGSCITEGFDREKTIGAAADYYRNRAEENGEYGAGERDAVLVTVNDNTESETMEKITLSWHAEKDDYDGGRADYYRSRGCI